jgi:hypothetical protein
MTTPKKKSQIQKFREAAREHGADQSEERFNSTLRELAKHSRKPQPTANERKPPQTDKGRDE